MELDDSAKSAATALIREAFDRARRSGKPDWQRMTTAVLKNRLLQITAGDFAIDRYGVHTVAEFARLFPEIVEVTESSHGGPAVVTLVSHGDGEQPPVDDVLVARAPSRPQVREDLWRATMDWNESHTYVVDPITGRARLRQESDSRDLANIVGVTKQMYVQWRDEFIEDALAQASGERDQSALIRWRDNPGPSRNLPTHLQDAWMDMLRTRVTDHIRAWFAAAGLPEPSDLTRVRSRTERTVVSAPVEVAVATQRLRDLVRRCVDQMSYEELRSLQLPASVIVRSFGR